MEYEAEVPEPSFELAVKGNVYKRLEPVAGTGSGKRGWIGTGCRFIITK